MSKLIAYVALATERGGQVWHRAALDKQTRVLRAAAPGEKLWEIGDTRDAMTKAFNFMNDSAKNIRAIQDSIFCDAPMCAPYLGIIEIEVRRFTPQGEMLLGSAFIEKRRAKPRAPEEPRP